MTVYVIMENRLDEEGNVFSSQPMTATTSFTRAQELISDAKRSNSTNVEMLYTDPCTYHIVEVDTID